LEGPFEGLAATRSPSSKLLAVMTVVAGPDWASATTAIGTVAVAVVAVGVALFAEWRGDRKLQEERRLAREQDQRAEAYAVQVLLAESDSRADERIVAVIIVNHSKYTITGIEARLKLARGSLVHLEKQDAVPRADDLDIRLTNLHRLTNLDATDRLNIVMSSSDRLAPWDAGTRFVSDLISIQYLPGAYPIVRWTDRWGTCWEHRQSEVRPVDHSAQWLP